MRAGDKIKIKEKLVSFHFDNLWRRQVTTYHLPIFAIVLDRNWQTIVTKVTKNYLYQNAGRQYKLSVSLVGFSLEVWWHQRKPEQQRIALNQLQGSRNE